MGCTAPLTGTLEHLQANLALWCAFVPDSCLEEQALAALHHSFSFPDVHKEP